MKRLFLALLCSFVGLGAYAADSNPNATKTRVVKLEINNSEVSQVTDNEESALRRRQIAFTFHDNCGGTLTVYVSAGDAVPTSSMASTAYNYACGYANAGGGCF